MVKYQCIVRLISTIVADGWHTRQQPISIVWFTVEWGYNTERPDTPNHTRLKTSLICVKCIKHVFHFTMNNLTQLHLFKYICIYYIIYVFLQPFVLRIYIYSFHKHHTHFSGILKIRPNLLICLSGAELFSCLFFFFSTAVI